MVRFTFSLNLNNRAAPKLYKHIIQVFFFSNHLSFGFHINQKRKKSYSQYCFCAGMSRLMTLTNTYANCIVLACYEEEELSVKL